MSRWLRARGYPTFTCGIASHAGCTTAMVELIERRLVGDRDQVAQPYLSPVVDLVGL